MAHDDRHRARPLARLVDEVDRDALDTGRIVVKGIDLALGAAPVVAVDPILDQAFQVIEAGAVLPSVIGEVGREARAFQALFQIAQRLVGNPNGKRLFSHAVVSLDLQLKDAIADRALVANHDRVCDWQAG